MRLQKERSQLNGYKKRVTYTLYLKKDNIYSADGERCGQNPKDTYAGDSSSLTGGFGVFSVGIKDAIDKVLN